MHKTTKTLAISLASILFLAILIAPSVYADESIVDVITIEVPSSCSMSATGMDSHTASVNNGQTTSDIGTTNINVICNDNSGYAIYAIGYTDDTYGKTVLTSYALGSTQDIITSSTITTGTSSWAMKLAAVSGTYAPTIVTNYASYYAVPQTYTKVAYYASSTDTGNNAIGSNLTTTYRAYISPTQPAGTYVGQVKYTLVHPNMVNDENKPVGPLPSSACPANYICYAPNADDIIGSMSLRAYSATSSTEVTLYAPNYSRPGYGFAGWSTDFEADNSSTIYGPNETITKADISANEGVTLSSQGLILYPVWIASAGNLQGWAGCSSLYDIPSSGRATLASMTALKDTRDNNVYAVAKLADGKCWMAENIRLDANHSSDASKAQGYGDATANNQGKFIGLADSEDANFTGSTSSSTDPTTANSIYYAGTQSGTATINIFQTNYAGFRMPRYNNNNTNMATGATNSNGTTTLADCYNCSGNKYRWFGYGNYYSWPAAIADTSYRNQNNTSATTTSICPTGWRLPIGGQSTVNTTGDFYVLTKTLMGGTEPNQNNTNGYGYYSGTVNNVDLGAKASKSLRTFPNNLVYSGSFNGSSAGNRSNGGYYWSSSANSYSYAYTLYFIYNYVSPGTSYSFKNLALSVRCIAQ